ncbi:tlde1 domain-containing protein [Mesorhizobium sp. L-8-10]|uniref:tlde1 domain-containing protein n=1 Tax=Mesorhizobium sp. L-8-10 TaxID=2744523 RepID=UPI0019265638|nr:tlde1 domain-containing protein [Mesorhizobium sp. L-8-10]
MSKVVTAGHIRRLLRPLLITCFGAAFAGTAAWSAAGILAMGSSFAPGSGQLLPRPQLYVERLKERPSNKQARIASTPRQVIAAGQPVVAASLVAGPAKSARRTGPTAGKNAKATRFDAVVKEAALTSDKLAGLFERAARSDAPTPERFAPRALGSSEKPLALLAYADPSPGGSAGAALSTLLAPQWDEDPAAAAQDLDTDSAALPSDGPLPQFRPRGEQAAKPAAEAEKPAGKQAGEQAAPQAAEPKPDEPRKADEREKPKQQKLAYARPDDPSQTRSGGGLGRTLRDMFGGGPKAGNGVAVYDISAAKVYMPDGSVLEAHSGIGKMADNPRYAHVKMNGPTPPHTYNLKMREKRFHGVEAIRMLPVDGKNKHGRDGFLTHSYLLRGGRAESHGCVAFKDYNRFLKAFKQGKIKQLVVVPSGGRGAATRIASSNGKSI